jgi:hypothetical protein
MKRLLILFILLPAFLLMSGCCTSTTDEKEVARLVDAAILKRQAEEDIARIPGFETTRICGRDVLRTAIERAQKEKIDLSEYRTPTITLMRKEGKMKWLVSWDRKGMPIPGFSFSVLVDDETGTTTSLAGM